MYNIPNLLLIAGTGRNTGKTTLACKIINKFSNSYEITGLKISPHFHGGTGSLIPIVESDEFNIYKETSISTAKDSSRMLKAGASKVFYIEVSDEYLKTAFERFLKFLPVSGLIVCESPALRRFVKPGLFFVADNEANANKKGAVLKMKDKADKWIDTGIENIQAVIEDVAVVNNEWKFLSKNG